jgi:hypothetical protein
MRARGQETARLKIPFAAAQHQNLGAARRIPQPHRLVIGPAHDAREERQRGTLLLCLGDQHPQPAGTARRCNPFCPTSNA